MRGYRCFFCDECILHWTELCNDSSSPSGVTCPGCLEVTLPYMYSTIGGPDTWYARAKPEVKE